MGQTLLATLALVVTASFIMSLNMRHVTMRQQAMGREFEEMAVSVAVESMEIIRSRAFDDAVQGTATTTTADVFTYTNSTNHFPTGTECSVFGAGTDNCDDVDDFHGMTTAIRPFVLGTDTIMFTVDVDVYYVNDQFQRNNGRTFNKEVVVKVRDTWPETGGDPFMPDSVRLSRVISYQF